MLLTIFLAGCGEDDNGLRYGFTTEPNTLDPLNPSNTADGRSILFNVFEGLVKPDTDGNMQPCIAESWTIEQDGLIYNFFLREGVFFHDNSPLTSDDVKFSLETAASMNYIGLSLIQEVKILDGNIVSVKLKSPDHEFLPYMTVGIARANIKDREKNAIGTGPFYIDSYRPQRNLVLKKFDKYWKEDLPHLNKVTMVFFENYEAMLLALRGGSIDGAHVTGSMAAQLNHEDFDILNNYSAAVQLLALNNAAPPLNDIRVRQALIHAINIQNIIDTAFFGLGISSGSPIIPGLASFYENQSPYPYNPDKARLLLAQAGFNTENKLSLEITVPSNYSMHVDTAQVIVNQLSNFDIDASIKLVDWNTWLNDVYFGRQYQSTIISLDSPVVSPKSFLSRYYSNNAENFINFNSPEFDIIYDNILLEPGETQRYQFYIDAQRSITQNAASVFLQDIFYFRAFRSGIYGGVLNYPLYVTDFAAIYRIEDN
jgi:peptide/nickel transport system substrate-binding protein